MTSCLRSCGTCWQDQKNTVSVFSTLPFTPFSKLPNSFVNDLIHVALCFGSCIRYQYSNYLPVTLPIVACSVGCATRFSFSIVCVGYMCFGCKGVDFVPVGSCVDSCSPLEVSGSAAYSPLEMPGCNPIWV